MTIFKRGDLLKARPAGQRPYHSESWTAYDRDGHKYVCVNYSSCVVIINSYYSNHHRREFAAADVFVDGALLRDVYVAFLEDNFERIA